MVVQFKQSERVERGFDEIALLGSTIKAFLSVEEIFRQTSVL